MSPAQRLKTLHADPAFAAARDERGRERFKDRHAELQARSNAKRRGVEVPPALEAAWKAAKKKRMTNEEAAAFLGLTFKGKAQ